VHVIASSQSMQSKKSGEASSQTKFLEQGPMDDSDDEQDEALLKLNKDELREFLPI
jgi:hypothetical protein